ncbi:MAG: spermidine synthase [Lysobacterales bacterium]
MIISLALLGYGASGTVIALARRWLEPRFELAFAASALLFSVSMVGCLVLGQRVPFNALEVIWDPMQTLYLGALYLLFMLPFFFAALCIGLAFTCRGERVDRIYFFDLLGAGAGAALVIGVLFLLQPQQAVIAFSGLALAASALAASALPLTDASRPRRWPRLLAVLQIAWLFGLLYAGAAERIGLRMSEFKGLSQALEVVDARVVAERSGPLGLLTVVESPRVPFRHAPGLSFTTRHLPPPQLALFTDGDGISVITAFDGDAAELGFLGDVTAALPYRLLDTAGPGPRVLVLGAGAGYDVLLALHNGASRIDAVELNPQVAGLMRGELAEWSGNLYEHERVTLHIAEARGYVSRGRASLDSNLFALDGFDLVQVALLDSAAVAGSGVQALSENYLYTIEAMGVYLDRLEPGGLLAVTRWLKVPPRDNLKMAATAIAALRRSGAPDPGRRLAIIRSWNTVTLLVKNGDFDERDTAIVQAFARERSFDVVWYPGMQPGEANHFNRLDRPWLYEGVVALLGERDQAWIDEYKFNISPATDQRPYFFDFFRWRTLPELLDLRLRGGAGLMEWGYLLLVATLLQALVAGAVLILLPLALSRRRAAAATRAPLLPAATGRFGAYFFLLGLAFLFVEMAFIQKFILFLAHPLYAVAVVLAGFLVFAGLGSARSAWLARRLPGGARDAVLLAVAVLAGLVMLYLYLLPLLFARLIGAGDAVRIATSLALIAPLAFCMGMPFPLGLRRLAADAPDFIPWAWALNGFASVISAALATLLAIEFGFNVVLLAALGCYGAAAALFRD